MSVIFRKLKFNPIFCVLNKAFSWFIRKMNMLIFSFLLDYS